MARRGSAKTVFGRFETGCFWMLPALLLLAICNPAQAQRAVAQPGSHDTMTPAVRHVIEVEGIAELGSAFDECCGPTRLGDVRDMAARLLRIAAREGRPLAVVHLDSITVPHLDDGMETLHTAHWRIDPGPAVAWEQTNWQGIGRLQPAYLAARVLPEDARTDPERVARRLQGLRSIESARFEGWALRSAQGADPSAVVPVFTVHERPAVSLEGVFGVASAGRGGRSADGGGADNQLTGSGAISLRDMAIPGLHLSANLLRTDPLRSRTDLRLGYQSQWAGRVDLWGGLGMAQEDSLYLQRTLAVGAEGDLAGGVRWQAGVNWQTVVAGAAAQGMERGLRSRITRVETGAKYASARTHASNMPAFVTSGWDAEVRGDFALGGMRQIRLDMDLQAIRPLSRHNPDWVLRLHAAGSTVRRPNGPVPAQDLIRSGGATDLRGYPQDGIRSTRLAHTSLDARWLADSGLYVFGFGTLGAAWFDTDLPVVADIDPLAAGGTLTRERLLSYGFGFSTSTRTGRLVLTAAFRPGERLGSGQLHVQWLPG